MKKENYTVTGMSCAACALAVEKAVNKKEGIDATVNLATEKMSVSFDESKYDFDKIREIVEKVDMDYWKRCLRMKRFRCIKIR